MPVRILKYILPIGITYGLILPKGTIVLSAVNQFEELCLYATVPTEEAETEVRTFKQYLTGEHIETLKGTFIDTVLFNNGKFVAHLFEITQ